MDRSKKQRWQESKRREGERRSEKRKNQKKEFAGVRKSRKVASHSVFPMTCASGGSKSRLAKAAGAEPSGHIRNDELHAVAAQSTFQSQTVQNTPFSERFWKLKCRKSARRCGAKHVAKSKCTKHSTCGSCHVEKCTPLWREARFQVKMYKTKNTMLGALLEVEMSKKCTPLWREAHLEVKSVKKITVSDHFCKLGCGFAWPARGIVHLVKSEQKR